VKHLVSDSTIIIITLVITTLQTLSHPACSGGKPSLTTNKYLKQIFVAVLSAIFRNLRGIFIRTGSMIPSQQFMFAF